MNNKIHKIVQEWDDGLNKIEGRLQRDYWNYIDRTNHQDDEDENGNPINI